MRVSMNCHRLKSFVPRTRNQQNRPTILKVASPGRRFVLAGSVFLLSFAAAPAQFEITSGTGNTSEDFDTLSDVNSSDNVAWVNDVTLAPGDSTLPGWSLFDSIFSPIADYRGGDGGSNAGHFYSFGTDTDRALGGVGSGGAYFGSPASGAVAGYIAFAAVNNSGSTLTNFTLGFDGEQWRDANTNVQTMVFEYGFGADFASISTWQSPGGNFNWNSPVTDNAAGPVDGNGAGLVADRGGEANGLKWTNGETLWLRWVELNDTGLDHGLAIDNFTFSWVAGVPPKSLIWTPGASAAWNTTTVNWLDGATPATFAEFDSVSFTDAGLGNGSTVHVVAGGVSPGDFIVSNTSGTYTFTGGPIGGSGILTKTGAGALVLATTYSRPIVVSEGSVSTTASDLLADTGSISLADGTSLDLAGNSDVVGALSVSGATISTGTGMITIDGNVTVGESDTGAVIGGNLSQGTSARIYTINDGAASVDLNIDAAISGSGRIRFSGAGTVQLNGDNSGQTGGFQIDPTIGLILGNPNALGPTVAYLNGGQLQIPGELTGANAVATPISLGGDPVFSGLPIELAGEFSFYQSVERSITIDNELIISGAISDGSAAGASLRKDGIGTLIVSGNNGSFSGAWSHARGTMVVESGNALGTGSVVIFPAFGEETPLEIAVSTTMGPLSSFDDTALVRLGRGPASPTPVVVTIAPTELITGSFAGSIQESAGHVGGVTIAGAGVQILDGDSMYSGPTMVESGTLLVTGSLNGTSGVEVAPNAILGGDGSINLSPTGSLLAVPGATLAPQAAFGQTGILTIAGDPLTARDETVMADGATFQFDLGSPNKGGTANSANAGFDDGLNITGTLSLDGGLLQGSLLFGFANDVGDLFFIISNDGTDPITGTLAGVPQGATVTFSGFGGSVEFAVSYTGDTDSNAFTSVDGNDLVLKALTVIPEPSTAGLLAVGLMGLFRRGRTRDYRASPAL